MSEAHAEEHSELNRRIRAGLHAKIVVIDRRLAVFGSANFTTQAWRNAAEQVLASVEPDMVTAICTSFDGIWESSGDIQSE